MFEVLAAFAASLLFSLLTMPLWPLFAGAFVHWKIIQGRQEPFLPI